MADITPGDIVWAIPDPTIGREQRGRRPSVVISSRGHLHIADTLAIVVPVTSVDRGWSNHVLLRGDVPGRPSWAMTEQVRTISRERMDGHLGRIDGESLAEIRGWVMDFIVE